MKVTMLTYTDDDGNEAITLQVERDADLDNTDVTRQVTDMLREAYYSLALSPLDDSEVVHDG